MSDLVSVEQKGAVLCIGVNRPEKRNAWNAEIIQAVARAYTDLAEDPQLRVGVLFGHGDHFTAGLDLMDVAPRLAGGDPAHVLPADVCDPWDFMGEPCPKPIVLAVHGRCNTLGIELALASQAVIAAEGTLFAQLEVARGIVPLGGANFRLAARLGARGDRWLLTAETFDAEQALSAGLVSELVPAGRQLERALEVAQRIGANAPLAVQSALAGQRAAERASRDAAAQIVRDQAPGLIQTKDALEGMKAMMERRDPVYRGE
jgi:enoyl-CoA hydratase/carnithine racemase